MVAHVNNPKNEDTNAQRERCEWYTRYTVAGGIYGLCIQQARKRLRPTTSPIIWALFPLTACGSFVATCTLPVWSRVFPPLYAAISSLRWQQTTLIPKKQVDEANVTEEAEISDIDMFPPFSA